MKTQIDQRFPEAGFVMVDVGTIWERRMIYAPASVVFRKPKKENEPLILSTGNWGELTTRQRMACRAALIKAYPNRDIILYD